MNLLSENTIKAIKYNKKTMHVYKCKLIDLKLYSASLLSCNSRIQILNDLI